MFNRSREDSFKMKTNIHLHTKFLENSFIKLKLTVQIKLGNYNNY